jgi:hypothetical protein
MHELLQHSYPNGTPYPAQASPVEAALRNGNAHSDRVDVFWRKDGAPIAIRYSFRPSTDRRTGIRAASSSSNPS